MPLETTHAGLSDAEAADRLRRDGHNELPSAKPRSLVAIAIEVVREPMFLLLIASGTVYLLLGDPEEAIALLAAVFLVIGITLYQEQKTERALQALRDLSSPRALVIRDGVTEAHRRPRGGPGRSRRAARGRSRACRRVHRDRAATCSRTSRSSRASRSRCARCPARPVRRRPRRAATIGPRCTRARSSFGATAIARVYATGLGTELGKIGTALARLEIGRTALQNEVSRMVRLLAAAGMTACVVAGRRLRVHARHRWLDGALAGLTLAISMVPEEFPVILTIFLALGAWRISRSQVLTQTHPGHRDARVRDGAVRRQDRHADA